MRSWGSPRHVKIRTTILNTTSQKLTLDESNEFLPEALRPNPRLRLEQLVAWGDVDLCRRNSEDSAAPEEEDAVADWCAEVALLRWGLVEIVPCSESPKPVHAKQKAKLE